MLDILKLEKLLIREWTEFLDSRKLLRFIKRTIEETGQIADDPLGFSITRFELTNDGFIIWIEGHYGKESKKFTIEANLSEDSLMCLNYF
jgi:hypothetical protein